MTRVVTFMMAREGSNRSYRSIGVSDGHHSVTHHMNDPEKIEKVHKINTHHVETFAYLLQKLQSTPDGDGTLLDHSLILYGSSISDGNAHTHHDLPIVLAGGGGGAVQGRAAHPVSQGYAAEQPAADHVATRPACRRKNWATAPASCRNCRMYSGATQ